MKRSRALKNLINSFSLRALAFAAAAVCVVMGGGQPAHSAQLSFTGGCALFAFTIFSFLLSNGYLMSSDRYLYAKRLLIFALIAEIPFDLLHYGYPVSSHGQNAIFALLIALCGMYVCDSVKEAADNSVVSLLTDAAVIAVSILICRTANVEPSPFAVAIPYVFCISQELSYPRLFQFAGFFALCGIALPGAAPYIAAAVLLSWLSTGERGPNALWLRYVFYASYPLMLTAVYLLRTRA